MAARTMGIGLCTTKEMSTTLVNCNCGKPKFSARRHVPLLLVHTGHDDKHLWPDDNEKEHRVHSFQQSEP